MTGQPTPEAVKAVADEFSGIQVGDGYYSVPINGREARECAAAAIEFIRESIHRDGPESDAIRDALGLAVEARSRAVSVDDGPCNDTCGLVRCDSGHHRARICFGNYRRVVGEWQEVQP